MSSNDIVTVRNSAAVSKGLKNPEVSSNVKVCVRVRPFNEREITENEDKTHLRPIVEVQSDIITLFQRQADGKYVEKDVGFAFDKVFWSIEPNDAIRSLTSLPVATQRTVFDEVGAPLAEAAVTGCNVSILAYGQTGSGKTHTMLGNEDDPGLAFRFVERVFELLHESCSGSQALSFTVEMSFLEIYNEQVRDLLLAAPPVQPSLGSLKGCVSMAFEEHISSGLAALSSSASVSNFSMGSSTNSHHHGADFTTFTACKVRNHPQYGPFVEGLSRLSLTTAEDCIAHMQVGAEHRATAATSMNATSSRSHAVFQLCIRQRDAIRGTQKLSVVNLVDLAGSERVKLSKVTGKAFTEATKINLSLSTLRRVIDILLENATRPANQPMLKPPYRDSTLTWLLADTLGGNSKTVMISTVSPFYANFEDTHNTLVYAQKAKAIVCHVRVNEERSEVVVAAIKDEMESLKRRLAEQGASQHESETKQRLQEELDVAAKALNAVYVEQEMTEKRRREIAAAIQKHDEELGAIAGQLNEKLDVYREQQKLDAELNEVLRARMAAQEQIDSEMQLRDKRSSQITAELQRRNSLFMKKEIKMRHTRNALQTVEKVSAAQAASIFRTATDLKKFRNEMTSLHAQIKDLRGREAGLEARRDDIGARAAIQLAENEVEQAKADQAQAQFDKLSTQVGDAVENKVHRIKFLIDGRKKAVACKAAAEEEVAAVDAELEVLRVKTENSLAAELEVVGDDLVKKRESAVTLQRMIEKLSASVSAGEKAVADAEKVEKSLCDEAGQLTAVRDALIAASKLEEPQVDELAEELAELGEAMSGTEATLEEVLEAIRFVENDIVTLKKSRQEMIAFAASKCHPSTVRKMMMIGADDNGSGNSPPTTRARFSQPRDRKSVV